MEILIGYDGSNAAKDAVVLAIDHAKAFGADAVVVTSRNSADVEDVDAVRKAEAGLDEMKKVFDEAGIACETHLLIRGLSPGEDLVKYAKDKQVHSIIIGVKRRSRVGKALFGSNAQYIILNAPCSVTTIR